MGMGEEVTLSLEETNKIRQQLGLKPIPVPSPSHKEKRSASEHLGSDPSTTQHGNPSTFSSTNFQFIENDKVDLLRKRLTKLDRSQQSKDLQDTSDKSDNWLDAVGSKRKRPQGRIQVMYEEEEEQVDNLPLLNMSHKFSDFAAGEDVILTLKEKTIHDNDDDDDILENINIVQDRIDAKNIKLRQMNKDRRRKRMKLNVSSMEFNKEESEENPSSLLIVGAESSLPQESNGDFASEQDNDTGKIRVSFNADSVQDDSDDGGDYKPIKIKKVKKKPSEAMQTKRIKLPQEIRVVKLVDEDFDLEEDYAFYKPNKEGKKSVLKADLRTPEEIAIEFKREKLEREKRSVKVAHLNKSSKGLVIDEGTKFLDSLKSDIVEGFEFEKTQDSTHDGIASISNANSNAISDNPTNTNTNAVSNESETPDTNCPEFYEGIASTLKFLQKKDLLRSEPQIQDQPPPTTIRNKSRLLKKQTEEVTKLRERIASEISANHRVYSKEELEKIKEYEEEQVAKQVNELQGQMLKEYNPHIKLVYKDKKGNQLTTREAYKKLSQEFHGTKSNKKKQAKYRSKIAARTKQGQLQDANAFDFL